MTVVGPLVVALGVATVVLFVGVYRRGGPWALREQAPAIGSLLIGSVVVVGTLALITSVFGANTTTIFGTAATVVTLGLLVYLIARNGLRTRRARIGAAVLLVVSLIVLVGDLVLLAGLGR